MFTLSMIPSSSYVYAKWLIFLLNNIKIKYDIFKQDDMIVLIYVMQNRVNKP